MKTLRLNRSSVSWSTYHHRQSSIEWLLKDEKGAESRSRPSNHDAGLFSTRHDVIRGALPICVQWLKVSKPCRGSWRTRGAFKFNSLLGWEIWKCYLRVASVQTSFDICHHWIYTRLSRRWNCYLNDRMWEIDWLVYLHDRNDSAGFCWKIPPWFRNCSRDPMLTIVLTWFWSPALEEDLAYS